MIQLNNQRQWLYAAVDSDTNESLHDRLCQACTTERTMLLLRELQKKVPIIQATVLIDIAMHLKIALDRLGLRSQVRGHGNRNVGSNEFNLI